MLFSPFIFLYFLIRVFRNPKYAGTLRQRLGFLPRPYQQTSYGAIWFHAVSLGEVIAIAPLVRRMGETLPEAPLFVSAFTLAGYTAAQEKLGSVASVFYAPLDYVFAVRRVLRHIRPSLVVVAETEIWPNLFRETKRIGCGLVMVNGRISDKALPRYTQFRWFFQAALCLPDAILAQSETARERFVQAGAPMEIVTDAGNLKYEAIPQEAAADSPVRAFVGTAKVWIAASTSADGEIEEEDAVLRAFQDMPGWKLLLAPRKPERFEAVAEKLQRAGLPYVRRSQITASATGDVLLLDTIGELAGLFVLADVVFMGGTLANRGGHNLLEPAFFAKPVVIGPHMENFREIADEFRQAHAVVEIASGTELRDAVLRAAGQAELGVRAHKVAEAKRGALARTARVLHSVYARSVPCRRLPLPLLLMAAPLSLIWKWGSRWKSARDLRRQRKLPATVISVGNLSVGGTGKTPFVLYLAEQYRRAGRTPGILTRGYRRKSSSPPMLVLAPGDKTSPEQTGDEAQIFLRSGAAPVGVSADRYATGEALIRQFGTDVLILDDGFQHRRLARDLDIVLVDALDPFGNCQTLPAGRLREPLTSLQRASVFVLTRVQSTAQATAIEAMLSRCNSYAPVFRSRIVPLAWVELASGLEFSVSPLPFKQAVAFCGLGNPRSFSQTLRELSIELAETLHFPDHHRYGERDLRKLGETAEHFGAEVLLTTEKDAINLEELKQEWHHLPPLYWLRIGVEVENEEGFLRALGLLR